MADSKAEQGGSIGLYHYWSAFAHGLVRPYLWVVLLAFIAAVVHFLVLSWYWTPERIAASPANTMMRQSADYYAWLTFKSYQLKRNAHPELGVFLLGASSARMAIQSPEGLGKTLSDKLTAPARFHLLAAADLSLWDMLAVSDYLPKGIQGVVLVSAGIGSLTKSLQTDGDLLRKPRLALDSAAFYREQKLAGVNGDLPSGNYLFDHMDFFSARARAVLLNPIKGAPRYRMHNQKLDQSYATADRWKRFYWPIVEDRLKRIETAHQANIEVLRRFVDNVRSHSGMQVVLWEPPIHPDVVARFPERYGYYRTVVANFAEEMALPLWHLDQEAGLVEADYRDTTHLYGPESRAKYEQALVARLVPSLNTILHSKGTP
ncbi:MAG: hypothetical protein HQL54_09130 [Magnetococcales bacterium]|nr:hypothetical protein [Magnetococcales bacterium]